jgi:hypothetical protein
MTNSWIALVLSSAAIGAFVSSVVTIVGQAFERKARRRELLLSKAIELAIHRLEYMWRLSQETRTAPSAIFDAVQLAEVYYQWLNGLLDEGEMPPNARPIRGAVRVQPPERGYAPESREEAEERGEL